jgi:hypothetical protein
MWQANELTSCVPYFIHVTWIRSTSESIYTFIIYNRYNTMLPTYEHWTDTSFLKVFLSNRHHMGPLAFIHGYQYVECTVQIVCGKVLPLSNCKHHFNRVHTKNLGKTARILNLHTRWSWAVSFSTGGREAKLALEVVLTHIWPKQKFYPCWEQNFRHSTEENLLNKRRSRDSSVGIATRATGWTTEGLEFESR